MLAIPRPPLGLRRVPASAVVLAGLLSATTYSFATLFGLPIWGIGLAVVTPWIPVFVADLFWVQQRYGWLALFYALAVGQTAHVFEHVAQMVQIHVLGLSGVDARGIFGALDIESVHFVWNTWVLATTIGLIWRFRDNPWLRVGLVLAGWHEMEHTVIFWTYLSTGVSGTPGLLAQGGALAGGLPIVRPDLHFLYNLVETAPLLTAFFWEVRRASGRRGSDI
jgi:hypothetical protein